jgi:hypothetical protein
MFPPWSLPAALRVRRTTSPVLPLSFAALPLSHPTGPMPPS